MKLLICDDDISTIDVIQSQLNCQELGITSILRAYNGEAAKEMILKEKPDGLLSLSITRILPNHLVRQANALSVVSAKKSVRSILRLPNSLKMLLHG